MKLFGIFVAFTVFSSACLAQSVPPAQPPSPDISNVSKVYPGLTVFGDSAACGYGATINGLAPFPYFPGGFASLMAPDFGGIYTNYCMGGDMSEDLVREWAMVYANPADSRNPTYVVETGANDAYLCQSGLTTCVADFSYAVQAAVAWLAIPNTCKVFGQATVATSGKVCPAMGPVAQPLVNWSPDNFTYGLVIANSDYAGGPNNPADGPPIPGNTISRTQSPINGVAISTTTPNASISFPVTTSVANQNIYCGWRVTAWTSSGPTANFSIDGSATDVWPSSITLQSTTTLGNGQPHTFAGTGNQTIDTVFVKAYPVATAGTHTLTVTAGAVSTANPFSFAWCGVSPQNSTQAGLPRVLISGVPHQGPGYASDATTLAYDQAAQSIATAFAQDGLLVSFADVRTSLIYPTDYYYDGLHPNNSGHQHARQAFETAVTNGYVQPGTFAPVRRP